MEQGPAHVILGGSAGIGLAYARRYARLGAPLIIVGRLHERLEQARWELRAAGAASVETISADLADPVRRAELFEELAAFQPHAAIFVGGPSPASGAVMTVTPASAAQAFDICVRYPNEVLQRAREWVRPGGKIVLLSSSAAREPLLDHHFFLSAAMRRILDGIAAEHAHALEIALIGLVTFRPKVVRTSLSEAFGEKLVGEGWGDNPMAALRAYFKEPQIPTADEYVSAALTGT